MLAVWARGGVIADRYHERYLKRLFGCYNKLACLGMAALSRQGRACDPGHIRFQTPKAHSQTYSETFDPSSSHPGESSRDSRRPACKNKVRRSPASAQGCGGKCWSCNVLSKRCHDTAAPQQEHVLTEHVLRVALGQRICICTPAASWSKP